MLSSVGGDRTSANLIGLCLVVLVLAVRGFVALPPVRRRAERESRRLWAWLVERLDPPTEVDELAEEMRQVMRGEKLRADLRRVQRLLVIDSFMPATRQMGNRIAYDWLVRELDRYTREVSDLITHDWNSAPDPTTTNRFAPSLHRPQTAQVEVLELGWRH